MLFTSRSSSYDKNNYVFRNKSPDIDKLIANTKIARYSSSGFIDDVNQVNNMATDGLLLTEAKKNLGTICEKYEILVKIIDKV